MFKYNFEKLEIWKLSIEAIKEVKKIAKEIPTNAEIEAQMNEVEKLDELLKELYFKLLKFNGYLNK